MGWGVLQAPHLTCATTTTTTTTSAAGAADTTTSTTMRRRESTKNRGCGVVALVLVLLLGIQTSSGEEVPPNEDIVTLSACFSSSDKVLVARCPPGHMVNIINVFYGHSKNGSCHYVEGDCKLKEFHTHRCVGRQSCEVNLPSGELGRQIAHCGLYSNYMQLTHTCVPETKVFDICKHDVLREQTGYIRTPSYPNNYPKGLRCTMSITAHNSQKIRLHVIDLDLESASPAGCADLLYVSGVFRGSSLCGQRASDEIFTTLGSVLHLNFTSDYKGQNKGFWLYYEAYPLLSSTVAPSTTPLLTTTHLPRSGYKHSTLPPSTGGRLPSILPPSDSTDHVIYRPNMQEEETRLPMEAIVGGLLGSLLCILLVLAILLFIKRRKEREAIPPSTSTCFLHSKTSSVPATSGPYIQNNLALVDDSPVC